MHLSGMSFYINPCSQYSLLKDTSKILFRLSAPNGRMCCFCEISFKCSINQLLEYHDLTKFISAKLLTNFTFALQRIPEWQFLIIFCYTELLFPSHSESDRTLISFRISRYRISYSSQLLEYRDLTKVIAARLLTNYAFVLWRISEW